MEDGLISSNKVTIYSHLLLKILTPFIQHQPGAELPVRKKRRYVHIENQANNPSFYKIEHIFDRKRESGSN